MATKPRVTYGQCQIYTTAEGTSCPLCGKPVTAGVGHYCEIREERKEGKDGK